MSKIMKTDIPADRSYTGWLWMSNANTPIVLENQPLPACWNEAVNPFVVEAQLWDADDLTAFSLHQAGNETIYQRFEVKDTDFNDANVDELLYVAHPRMNLGQRALHFLRYWEEGEPILGEIRTLKKTKEVFVGFKNMEEKA